MTEIDVRKDYIINNAASFYSLNDDLENLRLKHFKDTALNKFLDDTQSIFLFVNLKKSDIEFMLEVPENNDKSKILIFFKVKPISLTDGNYLENICISSILNSPINTLYYIIHRLYSPLFVKGNIKTSEAKVPKILKDLEINLQNEIFSKNNSEILSHKDILSVNDEILFWEHKKLSKSSLDAQAVSNLIDLLNTLSAYVNEIDSKEYSEIPELLENSINVLDDIWKSDDISLPQNHVENILDIIGNELIKLTQRRLSKFQLWDYPRTFDEYLENAITVCECWTTLCSKFTDLYWSHYTLHSWNNGPFIPENIQHFFETIAGGIDPLYYNCYTELIWKNAIEKFYDELKPAEEKIASKLRLHLNTENISILQLLQTVNRYLEVLKRPLIREFLIGERQNLLQQIENFLNSVKDKLEERTDLSDLTSNVAGLCRAQQFQAKVKEIKELGCIIFSDLNTYEQFEISLTDAIKELKDYEDTQFQQWSQKAMSFMSQKQFMIRTKDVVVQFEQGKLMHVNFSYELLTLVKETRQLFLLGYPISSEILEAVAKAKQFMSQAKALNQVASFHNTIGDRMINSQRSMMLNSARELAKLIQIQNTVTWENSRQVDEYIKKLQSCVTKLASQNNKLIHYHTIVMNKVQTLMDFDLIKQYQNWKNIQNDIKMIVSEVEDQFSNVNSWKTHIDHQIYKVMEYHYQLSLLTVNDFISDIHLELVYRNNTVTYLPSINQIRKTYYRKLSHYLAIPLNFKPIGDAHIYPAIIEFNSKLFPQVYAQSELYFDELEDFKLIWYKWLALSLENIDELMENIDTPEQWAKNFKASKFFGQQIARLPSLKRIGCFIINLDNLRSTIESQNRRYWTGLTVWLRTSIIKDISTIQNFLEKAFSIIDQPPQDIEDISESHFNHRLLSEESYKISKLIDDLETKNNLLQKWTKEYVPEVNSVTAKWTNFQVIMSNFHLVLNQQAESLKATLSSAADSLISEVERFVLRWNEIRPNEDKLTEISINDPYIPQSIQLINNSKAEWENLSKKISKMKDDHNKLNMVFPEFDEHLEVDKQLQSCIDVWGLLAEFNEGLEELSKEEWVIIRTKAYKVTSNFLEMWEDKLKTFPKSAITIKILMTINLYKEFLQYIKYLLGETFTENHWMEVFALMDKPYKHILEIKYGDLLYEAEKIITNSNILKEINARAASEVVIRNALSELDAWEVEAQFSTVIFTDSHGNICHILTDIKNILNKVGDHQYMLQSIKGSTNFSQFSDRVLIWEERLTNLDMCLRDLNEVQRRWAYLEPIFGKGTLENSRFNRIDKDWRYILSQIKKSNYKVVPMIRIHNLTNSLHQLLDNLCRCQNTLQTFLEDKRLKFPRFYFINDEDLLEILGQSNKKNVIQSHLKKIFSGVHSVEFDDDKIATVNSAQGENVPLKNPVQITENVEEWLENLSQEIKVTLKTQLFGYLDSPDPIQYPSQIMCLAERIIFTKLCEKSITTNNLIKYRKQLEEQHTAYTLQLSEWSQENTSKNLLLQLKLKALLMDTIYHMNLIDELISSNVTSINDWMWQKRLRFYLNDDRQVQIKIMDATFDYSYEYQGNAAKLVHTKLTDKCYITLCQAMSMGFGGNPYGPAGTGKTESVKALGSLLGRQVLVFNCDGGLDVKSLTRIMVGLVKCGAWGCFDEFNRLEETTLSLISSQIHIIQEGLRNKSSSVILLEKEVGMDHNAGIFITLNPAGKGYGGRQKLPENLKQLFRPVYMTKPDDKDIAQVILHCEGFKLADEIGSKLVTLFDMARKLLTQMQHYDWGLRGLKTVVGSCGHSLRKYLVQHKEASRENELELVVESVRLNTLPKLTFGDRIRFENLLKDIFPGTEFTSSAYETFRDTLVTSAVEMGLMHNDKQARKSIELFEQLQQRMGVVIVGPSGCGKSTIISLLKNALIKLGATIRHDTVNPKSMTKNQLLGFIDPDTRQWTNGVLTSIAQSIYNEPQDMECWVHCDGDIDPEWIESLNSVLDDNRLLTLPSGWRIQFGDNVHFIFETDSLSHASPATVSRMGVIFMSEEDLPCDTLINAWMNLQDPDGEVYRSAQDNFYKVVDWISKKGQFVIPTNITSCLSSCLKLMSNIQSKSQFGVTLLNGLASNLTVASKEEFTKLILQLMDEPLSSKGCFYYDSERDTISEYLRDSEYLDTPSSSLILTPEFNVAADVLKEYLSKYEPIILYGPKGSGKRNLLDYCYTFFQNVEIEKIECSALLSPAHIMEKFNEVCVTVTNSSRRVYRPKSADRLIMQLSDIDVIESDKWGSKILIEFLREISIHQGFYDQNMEWIGIENINFIYTITTTDRISQRFLAVNRLYSMRSPNSTELYNIYNLMTSRLVPNLVHMAPHIGKILVDVYLQVQNSFSNLSNNYTFSSRDISKLCQNLKRHLISDVESLVEALIFEAKLVFRYKLMKDEDQNKFDKILKKEIEDNITTIRRIEEMKDKFYGCDKNTGGSSMLRSNTKQEWISHTRKAIAETGNDKANDNFLVIPELLECISILDCILSETAGGILLAGKAGAGRKTALQIVSNMYNAEIFSPKLGENYSTINFKNDLKYIIQQTGINNEQIFLLVEDYQILNSEFLNMINNLVAAGEVLGLYHTEELQNLIHPLNALFIEQNFDGTLIKFFRERVRKNLHLVMIFDFENNQFFDQLKRYPAIFRNCYLIWFPSFSDETMSLIPKELLKSMAESNVKHIDLIENFKIIHNDAKSFVNVTPLSFLNFIKLYSNIYNEKLKEITVRKERLQAGVAKITEAQEIVTNLKSNASEQKSLLDDKKRKSQEVLDKISETMANASLHRNELEVLQRKAEEEKRVLQARKVEIDEELAEIEPLMEEARSAVGDIKAEALSEIRSLRAPPTVIRDILEGVLRLMGIQDTSWNSMKTFLSKRGVKEDIKCFDASQITEENRASVEQLLQKNKDSFDNKTAKRASVAAAPLAAWVKANVQYSLVLQKIRPLEREQNELERNLEVTSVQMSELGTGLQSVDTVVSKLKDQLSQSTKEATEIELSLNEAQNTINAAEELVNKLYDEYNIWIKQMSELSSTWDDLPKNSMLAAAFITYLPSASEHIRQEAIKRWKKYINHGEFSLTSFLSTERELLQWHSEGLPNDELSTDNGLIIIYSKSPPLIYDPSHVATSWLKEHFKNNNCEIVSEHNPKFCNILEMSVRFGKTLIVEEMRTFNPILMPILRQNFICQGPRKSVYIGQKLVDYNSDFKIYLSTRDLELLLNFETKSPFPTINYNATKEGLTQQLLGIALKVEKPKLEERRVNLLNEEEKLKSKLYFLQEKVLNELAESQGNILQNKELLTSLKETKESSEAITKSLEESYTIKKDLSKQYETFQPLAEIGAALFFACSTLSSLNNMYYLSVSTFLNLFQKSISSSLPTDTVNMKCQNLQTLTYNYISRSLFKSDRLAFALHLVQKTRPDLFKPYEWEVFNGLSNEINDTEDSSQNDTFPNWLDKEKIPKLKLLKNHLPSLYDKLKLNDENLWKQFMIDPNQKSINHCVLSEFQFILIVQLLRPDRLHTTLVNFALEALGLQFLMPTSFQLNEIFPETTSSEPILIITSPGTDPSKEIISMAESKNRIIQEMVVGPGQEAEILKNLSEASNKGQWILLKNLHLLTSWLPTLEKNLQNLLPHHKNFRLWLTTEEHSNFSIVLLSSCIKITYEAPPGIKRNLERTYADWVLNDKLEKSNLGSRSMFVLAWTHATLQERRTYIPQGWTSFYEFNDTDLSVAIAILKAILSKGESSNVYWEYLYGLYEIAVYGGRINNVYDLRVLSSYLRTFFTPDIIMSNNKKPLISNVMLPRSSNVQDHLDVIKQLPNNDKPEYFGLPKNVNRIWERVSSINTIEQVKFLNQNLTNFDRNGSMKKYSLIISPLLKLWKKLNQGLGLVYATISDRSENESPIASYFSLELIFATRLVTMIHRDLARISKSLKTGSFTSIDIESTANSLLNMKVPDEWEKFWSEPKNPKLYLETVISRALNIQKLYNDWENIENKSLDIAQFFNVDKFLTALRQQASRYTKTQIGDLCLNVKWGSRDGSLKNGSVTVPGLYLEGAILHNGLLKPTSENSPTSYYTDELVICWNTMEDINANKNIITVPLYTTADRTTSVAEIPLFCQQNEKHQWLQAGIAFYLNL